MDGIYGPLAFLLGGLTMAAFLWLMEWSHRRRG